MGYTACRANQGNAQQRMRWVQRARDDCTNHGDDEQGHREGCDREVLGGDQAEERQASSVLIWRPHPPSHQSFWKVHHWWLRPDGKTQVTIEYKQNDDGSVEPLKIHTVVISTQHAEPAKAVRSKECEGYKGPEMTAPTMEMMN